MTENNANGKILSILNVGHMPPRLGGSAFTNLETLTLLANLGHHVRCVTHLTEEHQADPQFDSTWRDTPLEVHPITLEFFPAAVPPPPEHMKRKTKLIQDQMESLIEEERPDVVMVGHESYAFYVNDFARRIGLPVVQLLHGTPTHGIDEGIYPQDLTDQFLESVDRATLIVGVSRYLARILNRHGIDQTTYIYNATDTSVFRPSGEKDEVFLRSLGLEISDKVAMHASNLKPVKRPLDIVHSAKIALAENPDLVYVIVGDGPLREPMEELVNTYGLQDRFRFVRKIPFSDMPRYFRNADVFLLPSEREGFGRVIREAQASSCVPIASNVGPLPEVISHGHDGMLVDKGDHAGLAATVVTTMNDEQRRREMGSHARTTAKRYDIHHMAADYVKALSDPLGFLATRPA